jgi:NCS1 family nucleobase:cation symporter-1
VLIVDYWVIRKRQLDLRALYTTDGAYRYRGGWNPAAVIATVAGAGIALAGAFVDALHPMYDWSWFVGFGVSAVLYRLLTPVLGTSVPVARVVRSKDAP